MSDFVGPSAGLGQPNRYYPPQPGSGDSTQATGKQLIRDTRGTSLRTTMRFGLIQLLLPVPAIAVIVVGVVAFASGSTVGGAVGVVLILAGVTAVLVLAMIFSAISSYATGRTVPGVDPRLFAGVFRQKRSRRGFA